MLGWTSFYDTAPLRLTLEALVDQDALADTAARPGLLVSATDIEAGQIDYFHSADQPLSLDHVLASASLPPSFPMTPLAGRAYWDGGLFDNTPLGPVLDKLGGGAMDERAIFIVNLFPNRAPVPTNMAEVAERTLNLQFANRTREDLKLMDRFDEVAALVELLDSLPGGNPVAGTEAFAKVAARAYVRAPRVIQITREQEAGGFDGMDFSPDGIRARSAQGYAATERALAA
jgi:predicted acylesterase/phospholipase RssA